MPYRVAPRTGAWIETIKSYGPVVQMEVAPRTGAWIETRVFTVGYWKTPVAPRTGAWIETERRCQNQQQRPVAPRTGAWIETAMRRMTMRKTGGSRPARARGLKQEKEQDLIEILRRAPHGRVD